MLNKAKIGKLGEDYATKFLIRQGYTHITSNFHTRYGEIDIICKYKNNLIFIEVKTRSSTLYGFPEEAVTKSKLKKLQLATSFFKSQHPEYQKYNLKIEIVSVDLSRGTNHPHITHLKDII